MKISSGNRIGRYIYLMLAVIFMLSIALQILFARAAIFVSPVHWMRHMTFVDEGVQ